MSKASITIQHKDDPSQKKTIWFKGDDKKGISYLEFKSISSVKNMKKAFGKKYDAKELAVLLKEWKVIKGEGIKGSIPFTKLFKLTPGKIMNIYGNRVKNGPKANDPPKKEEADKEDDTAASTGSPKGDVDGIDEADFWLNETDEAIGAFNELQELVGNDYFSPYSHAELARLEARSRKLKRILELLKFLIITGSDQLIGSALDIIAQIYNIDVSKVGDKMITVMEGLQKERDGINQDLAKLEGEKAGDNTGKWQVEFRRLRSRLENINGLERQIQGLLDTTRRERDEMSSLGQTWRRGNRAPQMSFT